MGKHLCPGRNKTHIVGIHTRPFKYPEYCPVFLTVDQRPSDCVDLLCEFCPEYLRIKNIKLRGCKYEHKKM